jgi:hypothetical protein
MPMPMVLQTIHVYWDVTLCYLVSSSQCFVGSVSSNSGLISSRKSDPNDKAIMTLGLVDPVVEGTTVLQNN